MNKYLIVLIVTLFASIAFAQPGKHNPQQKKEKIEQLKIAFFTEELSLSSADAERFWPIYHEMDDKIKVEKKKRRQLGNSLREGINTLSETDIKNKTNAIFNSEIREIELKKEYTEKIASVIGQKKATKLLNLEQRFKRELLNKLNNSNKGSGPKPGGPRPMN